MKELIFIQACPDDSYYLWQVHLWLESLKKIGKSNKAVSLIYIPFGREKNKRWQYLIDLFPESEFFFVEGTESMNKFIQFYIPIIRPFSLATYFTLHPELKDKAVLYCDADVIFTENFNIDTYLSDNICYVSDTLSYINSDYFDSKIKDVIPSRLEEYKKRDILDETCNLVGINRQIAEKNKLHSGGAQYLLKNIDADFWNKVFIDCLTIRKHLLNVNKAFFEGENKGFQSWASDMWAVLWNVWLRGQESKIVPEMEFAWSTDPIEKLQTVGILHNAGIVNKFIGETPVFHKGDYITGNNPFKDPHLDIIINNEQSKKLCNWYYTNELLKIKEQHKIEY